MVIIGPSNFSTSSWLPRQILHLDLSDDETYLTQRLARGELASGVGQTRQEDKKKM